MSNRHTHFASTSGNWPADAADYVAQRNNDWNQSYSLVPLSLPYWQNDPWSFVLGEPERRGPFGVSVIGFPVQPPQGVNPPLRQIIQESPPTPRTVNQSLPVQESVLTQEEQKTVIEQLKKQIYNPRRNNWCLYYRDNATNFSKRRDENEKCAICLEDFIPREEVLVTPCNHMFHDECILPWVIGHGQCPVCRFALYDQSRSRLPMNNNNTTIVRANDLTGDIFPLLTAMDLVNLR